MVAHARRGSDLRLGLHMITHLVSGEDKIWSLTSIGVCLQRGKYMFLKPIGGPFPAHPYITLSKRQ